MKHLFNHYLRPSREAFSTLPPGFQSVFVLPTGIFLLLFFLSNGQLLFVDIIGCYYLGSQHLVPTQGGKLAAQLNERSNFASSVIFQHEIFGLELRFKKIFLFEYQM